MNSASEGIYICSLCKAFICNEDEFKKNEIPHPELNAQNYIALNKIDNLCFNLDFTKKVSLNSGLPIFSYCGIIDLICNRCKQKIGFVPVSTTAQMNSLRDKIILIKERIIFNEVQVKHENPSIFRTPGRGDMDPNLTTEEQNNLRRKTLFEAKMEENAGNLQQAMAKCRDKYGVMFEFYKSLLTRLEVIENHNITLQTILFNLTKVALSHQIKGKISSKSKSPSSDTDSKKKVYLTYKPPKKEKDKEMPNIDDIQKLLAKKKFGTGHKKRKRDDEEEDSEEEEGIEKQKRKSVKPTTK